MKSSFGALLGPMILSTFLYLPTSRGEVGEQVILLHGYGRSASAMRPMAQRFINQGYTVHTLSYGSLTKSIDEIETEITQEIDQILQKSTLKTHFVGHSLGGLMVRAYLGKRELKQLGRVVILGSPNQGTPAVDYFKKKWWFRLS